MYIYIYIYIYIHIGSEKELVDIIDTLERAVGILEREMAKSGASLLQSQVQSAKDVSKNNQQSIITNNQTANNNIQTKRKIQ